MTSRSAVDRHSSRAVLASAIYAWRTVLTLAGVILVVSMVPVPGGAGGGTGSGFEGTAVFHLVGYAALTVAAARTTDRTAAALLAAASAATAYGAGIELLQSVVPWRSFAIVDIVLNAAGAGLAALAQWIRGSSVPIRSG